MLVLKCLTRCVNPRAELRGPDAGKERQARQEFKYACVGYSVWEDGTSGSGPEAGAHMPAVLCTGLEVRWHSRISDRM